MSGVTRLAPSPTGALHLGNIRTFLLNWAMARKAGWRIVLRIEDLDTPRVKPGASEALIDTLAWLGLDWDRGPFVQTADLAPYRDAMHRLAEAGLAYPCELTRRQIEEAASAPHGGDDGGETRFPPDLRPPIQPRPFDEEETNWRLVVPDERVTVHDRFCGEVTTHPARAIGDFVIWTRRAQPSYQLAVVVDDARQGVTEVVRADDLLDSAGRQLLLYRALGFTPEPVHTHLPLVVGQDGRRLAKRHGDTRVETYRSRGVPPEAVIGLVAFWSGLSRQREEMSLQSLLERYDLSRVPREQVVFGSEDDAWLMSRAG